MFCDKLQWVFLLLFAFFFGFGVYHLIEVFHNDFSEPALYLSYLSLMTGFSFIFHIDNREKQAIIKRQKEELKQLRSELHTFKVKEELRKGNYGAILQ